MATAAKVQKDKPHRPCVAPRQTAASVARAAHNATNRNLNSSPNQRTSPTRTPLSPSNFKNKSIPQRSIQKCDSKSEVKANRAPPENVVPDVPMLTKSEADTYIIDNNVSNVIAEEVSNVSPYDELEDSSSLPTETLDSPLQDKDVDENGEPNNPEPKPKSLPETPLHSRPQTPKSLQSSRPQTPRLSSRPTTPGQNGSQRKLTTTPTSRPNTPQRSSPHGRLNAPSALPVPTGSYQSRAPDPSRSLVKEEDDVKAIFTVKQKQFHRLKKELDIKQQTTLEVYNCLINLYDRMNREGDVFPEAAQIQELKVFNVRDWTAEEVAQLCRDVVGPSINNEAAVEFIGNLKEIDENILSELDGEVSKVPTRFADLCLQAFTARQELIDWVKELIEQVEDGRGESMERISRLNNQGLNLCDELRRLKLQADGTVNTVSQISRKACRERTALIAVGESLVREIARLRQDLEARAVIVNEMREIRAENECAKALEDTRKQLEEERAARANVKDKLATSESQLRQTRVRVSKLDQQLREAETSIANLTSTVKTLEDRCRQREVQFEARARKLKETLKTGEVASSQICQQRDALQIQVQSLKEQIETINAQNKITVQELNNEIKDLSTALDEQRLNYQRESELRKSLEKNLEDCELMINELKAKNSELESSRPNPELPTEREMDLWSELQATKETLRLTEDEVSACKLEKIRFLETLKKISESENKVGMQQKLAGELLSKEEIIGKMQIQIRELTKNMKLNEQKVIQYEQYVRTLQAHNRAVANCQEAPNGISYQDLQQEIMTLRMNLLESMHRNEEMSEVLAQKEQQLEQQDKTSRAQARVIKVREELINMLKNKETEQSRELSALQQDLENRMKIVDEVNKQIAAKADEIQELFATLENKQQQIHRLEKIVLALEEQQKRAQAQRTRHEEKIAALEHELAASGNRKERKFIFF